MRKSAETKEVKRAAQAQVDKGIKLKRMPENIEEQTHLLKSIEEAIKKMAYTREERSKASFNQAMSFTPDQMRDSMGKMRGVIAALEKRATDMGAARGLHGDITGLSNLEISKGMRPYISEIGIDLANQMNAIRQGSGSQASKDKAEEMYKKYLALTRGNVRERELRDDKGQVVRDKQGKPQVTIVSSPGPRIPTGIPTGPGQGMGGALARPFAGGRSEALRQEAKEMRDRAKTAPAESKTFLEEEAKRKEQRAIEIDKASTMGIGAAVAANMDNCCGEIGRLERAFGRQVQNLENIEDNTFQGKMWARHQVEEAKSQSKALSTLGMAMAAYGSDPAVAKALKDLRTRIGTLKDIGKGWKYGPKPIGGAPAAAGEAPATTLMQRMGGHGAATVDWTKAKGGQFKDFMTKQRSLGGGWDKFKEYTGKGPEGKWEGYGKSMGHGIRDAWDWTTGGPKEGRYGGRGVLDRGANRLGQTLGHRGAQAYNWGTGNQQFGGQHNRWAGGRALDSLTGQGAHSRWMGGRGMDWLKGTGMGSGGGEGRLAGGRAWDATKNVWNDPAAAGERWGGKIAEKMPKISSFIQKPMESIGNLKDYKPGAGAKSLTAMAAAYMGDWAASGVAGKEGTGEGGWLGEGVGKGLQKPLISTERKWDPAMHYYAEGGSPKTGTVMSGRDLASDSIATGAFGGLLGPMAGGGFALSRAGDYMQNYTEQKYGLGSTEDTMATIGGLATDIGGGAMMGAKGGPLGAKIGAIIGAVVGVAKIGMKVHRGNEQLKAYQGMIGAEAEHMAKFEEGTLTDEAGNPVLTGAAFKSNQLRQGIAHGAGGELRQGQEWAKKYADFEDLRGKGAASHTRLEKK